MVDSGLRPGCKVWFEKDGAAFGEGLFKLLALIEKRGSISAAASEMGMSYRTAWGKVRKAEQSWGVKLVDAYVGGGSGGGSGLTPEAGELMKRFREYRQLIEGMAHSFEINRTIF